MERIRNHWSGWLLLLLWAVLLLSFPNQSLEGARKGVRLCLDLILPSLFPFFVLSSLLIATGFAAACARVLGRILSPLFGVSGRGAAALLLGAVGGYPVGARTLAELVRTGQCTRAEARRLSLFCNNCGPAFFIGAAGAGIFGRKEAGFLLLGANLAAACLLGLLTHLLWGRVKSAEVPGERKEPYPPVLQALPDCVQGAFTSSLGVCAYVILFSVLVTLLDCTGGLSTLLEGMGRLLPGEHGGALCRALLTGFLEMSTGTAALAESVVSPAALPMAGFMLGWGGLSVHCQSLPFWREAGVPTSPYLAAKLAQGVLSAALVTAWTRFFPITAPVMAAHSFSPPVSLVRWELGTLWLLAGLWFFWRTTKKGWK